MTLDIDAPSNLAEFENPSFVLRKKLEVAFEERPVPELVDSRSVKVQVKKTGICGSDVHFYVHGNMGDYVVREPMVLGHESAGTVMEVGDDVQDLKVGDNVAMEPGVPSRFSKEYKTGHYNRCPHMKFAATPPVDGTLCKYYVLPEDFLVKLPEHVSLEEGAMVEPTAVAVHAVKQLGVTPMSNVVVFGAGPIGLLCAAVCASYGATTICCVDLLDSKLKLAKNFGASHGFKPEKGDTIEQSAQKIKEVIGCAPDICIDATGAEASVNTGVEALGNGGTYCQVGMGKTDFINFAITRIATKEINFKGSFRYDYGDYELATKLIADGKIPVKQLITHRVKFAQAADAYQLVLQGQAVKCVIDGPE
jgi:D-xylulose reductase